MTWLTALLLGAIEISSTDCSVLDVAEVESIAQVELSNAPPTATPASSASAPRAPTPRYC